MPESNYSISFNARLVAATSIGVGQALVLTNTGVWVAATAANRATYGRSGGVARTAYGGSDQGAVDIQQSGVVPASDTGLGAGLV